jgi:molybdopterin-guanine dinucleotide biosynthesis protein A
MGRDKARLPFRGGTLSSAVANSVHEAAGSATLVGNPKLGGIPDLYPGEGPLGGILTALHHTSSEWNLIVACDLPEITTGLLTRLLDTAESGSCDVLIPHTPGDRDQPLCAVYRHSVREALEARFQAGIRKVMVGLADLAVDRLEVSEILQFQNVNTPEDWSNYAER